MANSNILHWGHHSNLAAGPGLLRFHQQKGLTIFPFLTYLAFKTQEGIVSKENLAEWQNYKKFSWLGYKAVVNTILSHSCGKLFYATKFFIHLVFVFLYYISNISVKRLIWFLFFQPRSIQILDRSARLVWESIPSWLLKAKKCKRVYENNPGPAVFGEGYNKRFRYI